MRACETKVQPFTLDNLLEIRNHLAQRLNAMRPAHVTKTAALQDLFGHREEAINRAQVDQRITTLRNDAK